jgi:hypothetical protein
VEDSFDPFQEIVDGFTGRRILDLIFSSHSRDAKQLGELIARAVQIAFEITTEFVDDNLFCVRSTEDRWMFWVEVRAFPKQIKNAKTLYVATKTLLNGYKENPNYAQYYLLCGPSFGIQICLEAKEQGVDILWALSILSFIKGLIRFRTQHSSSDLRMCFPHFFDEQRDTREGVINYTLSTTLAFRYFAEYLNNS